MKTPRHRAAFTLIELLVVIAVVGVLATLIVFTIGKVREAARKTQSTANLRHIGQTALLYAQDNQDRLVDAQNSPNIGDRFSNALQNFLQGNAPGTPQYVSASGVWDAFRCPAWQNPSPNPQPWKTGFGMHLYLNAYIVPGNYSRTNEDPWRGAFLIKNFPRPAQTIIMGSTTDHVIDVRRSTGFAATNSDPTRHGSTSTYLFLDGRVASLTPVEALRIFP